MKTIPVSLFFATLLAPAATLAQATLAQAPVTQPPEQPRSERPQPRKPDRAPDQAWKKADQDGDGFLNRQEFDTMPRTQRLPEDKRAQIFSRLDKDGDGRLSRKELNRPRRPEDGPHHPPMRRLWELDTDKNGGVSFEEFKVGHPTAKLPPERQMEIFRRLDRDGDGKITRKDKPEPPNRRDDGPRPPRPDAPGNQKNGPKPPEPLQIFRQLDQNHDGALSFEEFRAGPIVKPLGEDEQEDRFEAMDLNKDIQITPEEMRPLAPRHNKRRGPPPSDDLPPANME